MNDASPIHALVALTFIGICLFVGVCYVLSLQKALGRCAPECRTITPVLLWFYLVPLANLVVNFLIVLGLARTLRNEFTRRALPLDDPAPGQGLGIAQAVTLCFCVVPFLAPLAFLVHLVLWLMYWNKIATYSRILSRTPSPTAAQPPQGPFTAPHFQQAFAVPSGRAPFDTQAPPADHGNVSHPNAPSNG